MLRLRQSSSLNRVSEKYARLTKAAWLAPLVQEVAGFAMARVVQAGLSVSWAELRVDRGVTHRDLWRFGACAWARSLAQQRKVKP